MGGTIKTGNLAHDSACYLAETARQSATVAITMNAAGQAALNTAEIAYCRAVIASCKANNSGIGVEPYQTALRALGTGGS